MSKVRIRYFKTDVEGIKRSNKLLCEKTGKYYQVILDENELMFYIKSIHQQRIIAKGGEGITSRHVLLRKIKRRLAKLGFEFDLDVRRV